MAIKKGNEMATTVYETIDIELMDGTKLKMRPLKISLLRDFMKKFDTVVDVATNNVESMDVLVECAMIAMQQYAPDLASDRDKFEDVADIKMVYKVIEAASGIKLDAEGNDQMADLPGQN
jgi:hypothetical protein